MTPQEAIAIQVFRKPPMRRFFFALLRRGWVVVPIALMVLVLTGCDEIADKEADAANLRDALAQAQQDRPDLWTPGRIERAGVAAGMVAQGVTK